MSTTEITTTQFPGHFAETTPDKAAVVMHGTGEQLTYAELHAFASRASRAFRKLGVEVGGNVAACLENRIEFPALHWGAHYAGAYYTFISTHLTEGEITYVVEDCGAKVFLVSDAVSDEVLAKIAGLPHAPAIVDVDGSGRGIDLKELLDTEEPTPLPDAVEGSEMMYSSGTTGRPKGIRPALTGQPLGSPTMITMLLTRVFGIDASAVYLSPAPYYHTAPCKWVQGVTGIGATAVLMRKFDAAEALAAIEQHRITHSQWVPTMFQRMLRLPEDQRTAHDVSSLKFAVHAAAPCPPDVKRKMIDWWGPVIFEYYGGTEGAGLCMVNTADWLEHPGTVGRPMMGKVLIVDDEGNEVPVGQEGLVCFGEGRQFEYHNDPEKTAEAYVMPGVSTMGDVGRLDNDGFLYLTDRKSNMIISGGVNIYPQETEDVLLSHGSVLDAAVIGIPHEEFGEQVHAIVQTVDGVDGSDALATELQEFCRGRLSGVKTPRSLEFRDELPRHPNGKLLKRKLRDEFWAGRESRLA